MLGIVDFTDDQIARRHEDLSAIKSLSKGMGGGVIFFSLSRSNLMNTGDHPVYIIPRLLFAKP